MPRKLSNIPYKGTNDYFPNDYRKLEYIFTKWREVCKKYAYKEYLTPVLEHAEIYEAKSGEDIRKELYTLMDKGNRKLSLRPEMTPSVTRLVTRIYGQETKPIRLYSIANFFRGERPQKGRGREFWQLNADIFGEESIFADLEVLFMALDIMLAFNPPEKSFEIRLNNRKLIEYLFSEVVHAEDKSLKEEITRKMDKFNKLSRTQFEEELSCLGLSVKQVKDIVIWMTFTIDQLETEFPSITKNLGFLETRYLLQQFDKLGFGGFITYGADLIRGFDYYDGMIFETFDLSGEFNRSIFGGGRYNGLAKLFGAHDIPAVGFAPGDMPISIFLDKWNLWPPFGEEENTLFLPMLQDENIAMVLKLARKLRKEGNIVEMSSDVINITKALTYANKKNFKQIVLYGTEEMKEGFYKIKDMHSGMEKSVEIRGK